MTDRTRRAYAARMPPDQRREQLLDAALRLIDSGGTGAVTVDAVARAAGVTRPVVYSVFDDACHLLRDLLERESRAALAEFQARLAPVSEHEDPARVAADTFDALLRVMLANPQRWRTILLPAETSPPEVREHMQVGRAAVLRQFTDFAAWAVQERGLDLDPEFLGHALLTWVMESGRLVLSDPGRYPPERLSAFARAFSTLVFAGERVTSGGMTIVEAPDVRAWRDWLAANGETEVEVWLVLPHKKSGIPGVTYEEAVEHALCFGWIDSTTRKHDAHSSVMRFSPRRSRSKWSRSNVERVARLTQLGLMTPSGQAAIDAAKAAGMWPDEEG